jgi:hypothetical protein
MSARYRRMRAEGGRSQGKQNHSIFELMDRQKSTTPANPVVG